MSFIIMFVPENSTRERVSVPILYNHSLSPIENCIGLVLSAEKSLVFSKEPKKKKKCLNENYRKLDKNAKFVDNFYSFTISNLMVIRNSRNVRKNACVLYNIIGKRNFRNISINFGIFNARFSDI